MQAGDIMVREVVTVRSGASLAVAASLLFAHRINAMPVLDEANRVVDMIGIRDVLRVPNPSRSGARIIRWDRLEDKANLLAQIPVDQVMTRQVVSAGEGTDVNDIVGMMVDRGVHPIPILREGRLCGVVGRADVARVMLTLAAAEAAMRRDDAMPEERAAAPADVRGGAA